MWNSINFFKFKFLDCLLNKNTLFYAYFMNKYSNILRRDELLIFHEIYKWNKIPKIDIYFVRTKTSLIFSVRLLMISKVPNIKGLLSRII